MLTGSAANWFDNTDFNDDSTTFDNFKEAFLLRYQTPNITKYQSVRDIFSRIQGEGESVNLFIDKMQKVLVLLECRKIHWNWPFWTVYSYIYRILSDKKNPKHLTT